MVQWIANLASANVTWNWNAKFPYNLLVCCKVMRAVHDAVSHHPEFDDKK
tara:strand:+ start:275 stop:424 length:150 start_codon:yes stop_codon:yes gene_type:complete